MLHRQKINIQKPIHAIRQAPFLALLQLRALDVASHALFPANLRQVVRLGLNLRSLLLIRKKLAQLRLIFIVELFEIEVLDSSLCGVHGGQPNVYREYL